MSKEIDNDEDREGTISRRRFIQGVIATSAAAGVAGLSANAIMASSRQGTTVVTGEHSLKLKAILNHVIPAQGRMPAAGDLGTGEFIERVVAAAPHLRRHIIAVLTAVPDPEELSRLSEKEFEGLLKQVEREQHDSFDLLLQATYAGYYGHPQVQAALGWMDFEEPQLSLGPFDPALLDKVRARGALYEDS